MRFMGVLFGLLLAGIAVTSAASALEPFTVSVHPLETELGMGEFSPFQLTVTNNQPFTDKILLVFLGEHREWLSQSYILMSVEPATSRTATIGLYATSKDVGVFPYTIKASSIIHKELKTEAVFMVTAVERLKFTSLTGDVRGGDLNVVLNMEATQPRTDDIMLELVDGQQNAVTSLILSNVFVESKKQVVPVLRLPKHLAPGQYTLRATAALSPSIASVSVTVPVNKDIIKNVKVIETSTYRDVVVELVNDGNVVTDAVFEQKFAPKATVSGMAVAPSQCIPKAGEQDCSFVVADLAPGQSRTLTWRIEKWVTPLQAAIGGVMAVLAGMLLVHHQTTPRLHKRSKRKSRGRHAVVLEIRNPRGRKLQNVVVRDTVSPLAEIDHSGFEPLRPAVRKHSGGTELIWNLGDMNSRETRMLSYKINTLVGGSLKMPPARMRYALPKNRKQVVRSRHLTVE